MTKYFEQTHGPVHIKMQQAYGENKLILGETKLLELGHK